ncbi:MAG: TniB family NTP-binding protein [Candidatus Hodarchaeota archaeon]
MKLYNEKKLVIIDEFEKLYEISHESRGEILAGFHSLINTSSCPIAIVGIDGVDDILKNIASDKYTWLKGPFSTRFPGTKIPSWEDDSEFKRLLVALDRDCLLHPHLPEGRKWYEDDKLRECILDLSEGLLGKIILLVKFTARHLIRRRKPEIITIAEQTNTAIRLEAVGWDMKEIHKTEDENEE